MNKTMNKSLKISAVLFLCFFFFACENAPKKRIVKVEAGDKQTTQIENKTEEKPHANRDLSDGKFSKQELDFIIEEFKKEVLKYAEEDLGAEVKFGKNEITIHAEGKLGYVPAIELKRNISTWVAGDLDQDGTNEIIFDVFFTGGGTAYWYELYCLKIKDNGIFSLIHLAAPCPCKNNLACHEPTAHIIGFSNNLITINAQCFGPYDANCCPSSNYAAKYKFAKNKLLLVK